jgi:ectoine hydroxylase-related dioxygenase (phytanoyl-CoA dioxygenase family)
MEFVRGSHRWNRWFQPRQFGEIVGKAYEEKPDDEETPDIESARSDYDIVGWESQAGDCYVLNGMTVHGARGNTSEQVRRRRYTVRYTGENVRYDPPIGTSKPLLNPILNAGDKLDSAASPQVLAA